MKHRRGTRLSLSASIQTLILSTWERGGIVRWQRKVCGLHRFMDVRTDTIIVGLCVKKFSNNPNCGTSDIDLLECMRMIFERPLLGWVIVEKTYCMIDELLNNVGVIGRLWEIIGVWVLLRSTAIGQADFLMWLVDLIALVRRLDIVPCNQF